jgi:DNA polymerase-3 subunit chi
MPQVSFYLLPSDSETERCTFVCKLVEKAYREKHRVYLQTASDVQAQQLDDMLWTFRAGSFIPHQIYSGTPPSQENPVTIGTLTAPQGWRQTLLNLATEIPDTPEDYQRIIEVLDNSENCKQEGRIRYRRYRECGLPISTHSM